MGATTEGGISKAMRMETCEDDMEPVPDCLVEQCSWPSHIRECTCVCVEGDGKISVPA